MSVVRALLALLTLVPILRPAVGIVLRVVVLVVTHAQLRSSLPPLPPKIKGGAFTLALRTIHLLRCLRGFRRLSEVVLLLLLVEGRLHLLRPSVTSSCSL